MAFSDEDRRHLHRLAVSEGWRVLEAHLADLANTAQAGLVTQRFADLQVVGQLQGRATAFQQVVDTVNGFRVLPGAEENHQKGD